MRLFLLLILLTSCNANFYLKKAERALAKAEQLGAKIVADTVYRERLVFIDSIRVDSIFSSTPGDTVIISKDRLEIKYVRLRGDSVFIQGECKADTVTLRVPVSVVKEIKSGLTVVQVVQWSLLALIVGAVLCKIFWR